MYASALFRYDVTSKQIYYLNAKNHGAIGDTPCVKSLNSVIKEQIICSDTKQLCQRRVLKCTTFTMIHLTVMML